MTGALLYPVAGLERTTSEFRSTLVDVAQRLGIDPTDLAAIIAFESAFNPQARNVKSGATGLIQWLPSTAIDLYRLTTAQIAAMSAVQQLELVRRYFAGHVRPQASLHDLYMLVWAGHPASMSEVLGVGGAPGHSGQVYDRNSVLDSNRDGRITGAEASAHVRAIAAEARRKPPWHIDPKAETPTESGGSSGGSPSGGRYRIVIGDCPWAMASRLAGSGSRWRELYACNPRSTVDGFRAGDWLNIPNGWRHV